MIKLPHEELDPASRNHLATWQIEYSRLATKMEQEKAWNNQRRCADFKPIEDALKRMLDQCEYCMYCEDNRAKQVEHFWPRAIYPELAFEWLNYLFVCGDCNSRKSDQFATIASSGDVTKINAESPNRCDRPALINPRYEDPLDYFYLDILGKTFMLTVHQNLTESERKRANITKKFVPALDDDLLNEERRTHYGTFMSDLERYIEGRRKNDDNLMQCHVGRIRRHRHRSVFREMQRQWSIVPELRPLFEAAPEAQAPEFPTEWKLNPTR